MSPSSSASSSASSSSPPTLADLCQSVTDAVLWYNVVALTAVFYQLIIVPICLHLQESRRVGESSWIHKRRLGRFWIKATVPWLVAITALVTVLRPVGTPDCPVEASQFFVYPGIATLICFRWIANGFALIQEAEAAAKRNGEEDDQEQEGHVALLSSPKDHSQSPLLSTPRSGIVNSNGPTKCLHDTSKEVGGEMV